MVSKIGYGQIWWANLPDATGSEPGFRRPVLVLQSNRFNESKIATVVVAMLTSNLHLAQGPGNVLVKSRESGLSKDSVVNISQLATLDKVCLTEFVSKLDQRILTEVKSGIRLVLDI
jgi:mRNA interferase MazF